MLDYEFSRCDGPLVDEFESLMRRSYGFVLPDLRAAPDEMELVVGRRAGRIASGGLGFLGRQVVGGGHMTAAVLGSGCVAPEERGGAVALESLSTRVKSLADQGAVTAVAWSTASGSAIRHGWSSPTVTFSAEVPTAELAKNVATDAVGANTEIWSGSYEEAAPLRSEIAAGWNGAVLPPQWWGQFMEDKHGTVDTYHFVMEKPDWPLGNGIERGALTIAFHSAGIGRVSLIVHEFWAEGAEVGKLMLGFLGRFSNRAPAITFQPTALSPSPFLREGVQQTAGARLTSRSGWWLKLLDVPAAISARGWHPAVRLDVTIQLRDAHAGGEPERYRLQIRDGLGHAAPVSDGSDISLTRTQLAGWFVGAYQSQTDAAMTGLRGDPTAVTAFLAAAGPMLPWMPIHF